MKQNLQSNPVEGDEKIAIVCHSHIIAAMTADGVDLADKRGYTGYTWTDNCQLLPFSKF